MTSLFLLATTDTELARLHHSTYTFRVGQHMSNDELTQ